MGRGNSCIRYVDTPVPEDTDGILGYTKEDLYETTTTKGGIDSGE